MVTDFCRHVGVAFQVLNDLKDWEEDSDNKVVVGQDVLAGRPTLLLALALEGLAGDHPEELVALLPQKDAAVPGHAPENATAGGAPSPPPAAPPHRAAP